MHTKLIMIMWMAMALLCVPSTWAEREEKEHDEDRKEEVELGEKEVMRFLKKNLPEAAKLIKVAAEEESEEEYDEVIEGWADFIHYYHELQERSSEMAENMLKAERMEMQIELLEEKFHDTKSVSKKKEIKNKIEKMLHEIFDIRLKEREFEIKILQKEINEIKEVVEKRKAKKAKIIDRRLKELLSDEDNEDLEWW